MNHSTPTAAPVNDDEVRNSTGGRSSGGSGGEGGESTNQSPTRVSVSDDGGESYESDEGGLFLSSPTPGSSSERSRIGTESPSTLGQGTSSTRYELTACLFKRRGGFGRNAEKNWKKRSFTLLGSVLCYYDSLDVCNIDPSRPRGRLNLLKEDTVAEMHRKYKPGAPTEFLLTVNIYVLGGKKKWEMCCADREEQAKWYEAIARFDGRPDDVDDRHLPKKLNMRSNARKTVGTSTPTSTRAPVMQRKDSLTSSDHLESSDYLGSAVGTPTKLDELMTNIHVIAAFGVLNFTAYLIHIGSFEMVWVSVIILNLNLLYLITYLTGESTADRLLHKKPITEGAKQEKGKKVSIKATRQQSFVTVKPAGMTISRAAPLSDSDVAKVISQHGPISVEAARAYAAAPKSSYDETKPHTYWNIDANLFNLRIGPNYKKNRQKAPSSPALYDLFTMDVVKADGVLKNVADGFRVPKIPGITDAQTGNEYIPPMFVINCWLPAEATGMFNSSTDGPSFVVVLYFVISERTLTELKDFENASPGVKLLSEWCDRAEKDDSFRGRFKAMGSVEDIEKTSIPSFIQGYNGKPALVTKSGTFTRHSNYIEMAVNVHGWSYMARKGLYTLMPMFSKFILDIGFTIEARKDHELPEVLIGGCRVLYMDPEKAQVDDADGDVKVSADLVQSQGESPEN